MPSITPDEARVWLTVRHESFETARDAYREIAAIGRDAARMAGVSVREQLVAASRGYLPNDCLARILDANLRVRRPAGVEPRTISRGRSRCPGPAIRRPPSSFTAGSPSTRRAVIRTARTTARRAGGSRSGA